MLTSEYDRIRAIDWRSGALWLLDQRLLPERSEWIRLETATDTAAAIRDMVVRGAPAIGIAAAYGVVLAARDAYAQQGVRWREAIEPGLEVLACSRPTAVNLFWALHRMREAMVALEGDPEPALLAVAHSLHEQDVEGNRRMGDLGAALIAPGDAVLTHCNTGSLATGGYGTALGVIRAAYAQGRIQRVFADETRPWLQGARLTAWELVQDEIPVSLLADGAAAYLMRTQSVSWVIVGADRIAANGDAANKIGTYSLAVNARAHDVRFMVVAPTSTIDMNIAAGQEIPIEQRAPQEVLSFAGHRVAPEGALAWNPVFDVTPASLIDAIVTERGVVYQPTPEKMVELMG